MLYDCVIRHRAELKNVGRELGTTKREMETFLIQEEKIIKTQIKTSPDVFKTLLDKAKEGISKLEIVEKYILKSPWTKNKKHIISKGKRWSTQCKRLMCSLEP